VSNASSGSVGKAFYESNMTRAISTRLVIREGDAPVLVVCNFTPVPRENYRIGAPRGGRWVERINTDSKDYGGSGMGNMGAIEADDIACHGRRHSLNLTLPPLGALILEPAGS
jgi:1,4-alpha-glucan branching enzyme